MRRAYMGLPCHLKTHRPAFDCFPFMGPYRFRTLRKSTRYAPLCAAPRGAQTPAKSDAPAPTVIRHRLRRAKKGAAFSAGALRRWRAGRVWRGSGGALAGDADNARIRAGWTALQQPGSAAATWPWLASEDLV